MDKAIEKYNSEQNINLDELKNNINELKSIYNTITNTTQSIRTFQPTIIKHTKLVSLLPENTLLISLAYKNLIFIYNSFKKLKNLEIEINEIYPLTIENLKPKYLKWKELNEFKQKIKKHPKLQLIDKLERDLEIFVISFDFFEEIDSIEQIDFIIKDNKNWKEKFIKEIKRRIVLRSKDYSLILEDFRNLPESKIENIFDKRELINYYFFTVKENCEANELGEILRLLEFEKELKIINEANFINLPPLLDDYHLLIQKYSNASKEKIENWMNNLKLSILNSRTQTPTVDENNKFISTYFITLYDLIRNQIEPVKFSSILREEIEKSILKEAKEMIENIKVKIQNDFSPAVNLKGQPGYEEYIIMLSNSSLKLAQFANDSLESVTLSDAFIDLMDSCNSILANFIIATCKPILNLIFTDKWYDRETNIIPTLNDFFIDYKYRMNDYNFYSLIKELNVKLTEFYYKQIIRNRAKIFNECAYVLKKDILDLEQIFFKFGTQVKVENLKKLKKILEEEGEMFLTEIVAIKDEIPREVIISIIKKKEDVVDKEELIRKVKEIYGNENKGKGFFGNLFG